MFYNNIYKVFKRSVAIELRKRGFKILKAEPNYKKPQYDVYFFEDTEEFRNALSEVARD